MSEEKFWATCPMNKKNMGEIISLLRNKHSLSQEDFAKEIGCSLQILKSSENGKGAHVYGAFVKAVDRFDLDTKLTVTEK